MLSLVIGTFTPLSGLTSMKFLIQPGKKRLLLLCTTNAPGMTLRS
ncbi:hypothetical protein [Candidatus Neptunichlamydia sp. REUL1]|nr:hypothetical protein [Candidatus Neptunochlamydia sp. REUL1]